jgi:hypothetical protein
VLAKNSEAHGELVDAWRACVEAQLADVRRKQAQLDAAP